MAKKLAVWTVKRIRALRGRLQLTQAEAAARVAVTQNQWSLWESGKRKPSRQSAMLLDLLDQGKI